jgi:uncharacterized iron-regulated membrane protein
VSPGRNLTLWQRWVRQPQKVWLRRAFFQLHLWSGLFLGVYVVVISVTGSVLVYRNELYRAATVAPVISTSSAPRLTDRQIADAATRLYPGYRVVRLGRWRNPDQAVDVLLSRGGATKKRMFDPRTGADLGDSVPTGIWLVSRLADLHDDLFFGPAGRKINGVGALAILLSIITGLAIWWPGIKKWRRSLFLPWGLGWRRAVWHLHSAIGLWSFAFLLLFALSGIYLCLPEPFLAFGDWLQPPAFDVPKIRAVDQVIYWLAYLHFGRVNGVGILCGGPGTCDKAVKAAWAFFGLAPATMAVTGAILWWNRVLRPWQERYSGRNLKLPAAPGLFGGSRLR